jgi:hypothetical protein
MSARLKKREETKEEVATEQPRSNVVVGFPQPETTADLAEAPEEMPAIEALTVNYDSIKVGQLERGALLRIFREQWRGMVSYHMSPDGGKLSLEDACTMANARYDKHKTPHQRLEELLAYSTEAVSFHQLMELWECSPEDAEKYFACVKHETQREFSSGHLAAKVFEPVDWMNTVWKRAQFLAIRDTFIAEFRPEGGVEYSLIDMMVQAYFMEQYWMEETVKRTRADPRRESYEYSKWQEYKRHAAKAQQWESAGYWEIPYASELACVENAANMTAMFSQMYQRALRQLNNHRLFKLKVLKLKAETRRINALTRLTIKSTKGE